MGLAGLPRQSDNSICRPGTSSAWLLTGIASDNHGLSALAVEQLASSQGLFLQGACSIKSMLAGSASLYLCCLISTCRPPVSPVSLRGLPVCMSNADRHLGHAAGTQQPGNAHGWPAGQRGAEGPAPASYGNTGRQQGILGGQPRTPSLVCIMLCRKCCAGPARVMLAWQL